MTDLRVLAGGLADPSDFRVPVANESERAVLGGVIQHAYRFAVAEDLRPHDFHLEAHQAMWAVMGELHAEGKPAGDTGLIWQRLTDTGRDRLCGPAVLASVMDAWSSGPAYEVHVAEVASRAMSRRVLDALQASTMDILSNPHEPAEEHLGNAESRLLAASEGGAIGGGVSMREATVSWLARRESGELAAELQATGITALDDALHGGPKPGDAVVIVGCPGDGKSALALGFCAHAEAHSVFGSWEMPEDDFVGRMLAFKSGVPMHIQRSAAIGHEDLCNIEGAAESVVKLPIILHCYNKRESFETFRVAVRREHRKHGKLAYFVVDHLHLVGHSLNDRKNDEAQLAHVCIGVKALAKELRCVGVLLVQPIKEARKRLSENPAARLSPGDCKGSSAMEDIADVLLIPYRRGPRTKKHEDRNHAEIDIVKFRSGDPSVVRDGLRWNGARMRFEDGHRFGHDPLYGGQS